VPAAPAAGSAGSAGSAGPPGVDVRRRAAAQVLVADPASPLLTGRDAHHLGHVLRLSGAEVVVATDGRGRWARCRYRADGTLEPDGPVEVEEAPRPSLTVAFAPVKAERPDFVVQKLTELGIDRIVVLATDRSVVRWDAGRARSAIERLRRVAAEAACQARHVWLPEVAGVLGLGGLGGVAALAEPGAPPLRPGVTGIAVGPEGGWSDEELSSGLPSVGLATHVLRAETAAVAAGVLLGAQRAGTVARHGR